MQGDWILTVTGPIVSVLNENVDKSGRHPKLFYEFHVRPDSMEIPPEVVKLPAEIAIRVKEVELHQLTSEVLSVGDRVVMSARANGPSPNLFYLISVKKLAAA